VPMLLGAWGGRAQARPQGRWWCGQVAPNSRSRSCVSTPCGWVPRNALVSGFVSVRTVASLCQDAERRN